MWKVSVLVFYQFYVSTEGWWNWLDILKHLKENIISEFRGHYHHLHWQLLLRGENILHFCQNIPRALTLNKDCKGCQAPPLSIGPVMLETKPAPPRGDKTLHSSLSFKSILPFQIISSLESFQQGSSKSRLSLLQWVVFKFGFFFSRFCKRRGVTDAEKCNPCISDGWGETVGRDLGRESQTTESSPTLMPP